MYGEIIVALGVDEEGWEGDDATITCPCGHTIEPNAPRCPDGCANPLREAGVI